MAIAIAALSALALLPITMAQGSPNNDNNNNSNTVGVVNYYFVFVALIVLAAFLAVFFMYKKKQKQGAIMSRGRESALQQDVDTWDQGRVRPRYRQGRWRSADIRGEEGLNEHGEAPPPYVPKSENEETNTPAQGHYGPEIPLATLSREQAGLKPPDYVEATVRATDDAGVGSQQHDRRPGSSTT